MPGFQAILLKFAELSVNGKFQLLKTYNSFF